MSQSSVPYEEGCVRRAVGTGGRRCFHPPCNSFAHNRGTTGAKRTRGRICTPPATSRPTEALVPHGSRRQRPIRYCPSTGGQDARARTRRGPGRLLPNNRDEDEDRSAKKKFPLGASHLHISATPPQRQRVNSTGVGNYEGSGCNRWGLRVNVHAHTRGGKGGN